MEHPFVRKITAPDDRVRLAHSRIVSEGDQVWETVRDDVVRELQPLADVFFSHYSRLRGMRGYTREKRIEKARLAQKDYERKSMELSLHFRDNLYKSLLGLSTTGSQQFAVLQVTWSRSPERVDDTGFQLFLLFKDGDLFASRTTPGRSDILPHAKWVETLAGSSPWLPPSIGTVGSVVSNFSGNFALDPTFRGAAKDIVWRPNYGELVHEPPMLRLGRLFPNPLAPLSDYDRFSGLTELQLK
jgi:hypothetical protein